MGRKGLGGRFSNTKAILCMLFVRQGEEVKRLTAVEITFPAKEKECMQLSGAFYVSVFCAYDTWDFFWRPWE